MKFYTRLNLPLISLIHHLLLLVQLIIFLIIEDKWADANPDARRLYDDLLRKNQYNKLIRPVQNASTTLTVSLYIKLSQIVDVDEKNEILTLNMWVLQEWRDSSLRWEPEQYGGVDMIYVPAELIWIPDVVLYNNADGDYTITLLTKATIKYDGNVTWEPPAIYKSNCAIDVTYFPFDEQDCMLKFGIWTYDGFLVDMQHKLMPEGYGKKIPSAMKLKEYYKSVEWDLMEVSAQKNIEFYPCCEEPYPDITFNLRIRRKTLYYSINLIVPCVAINMLTILAFYLPSDCGEKISVCISILLSLSLFQLLLMDLMPGTSLVTPLIGKYLLFTCFMVSASVICSVIAVNYSHRTSNNYSMSKTVDLIFLRFLPKLLCIEAPKEYSLTDSTGTRDFSLSQSEFLPNSNPYKKDHTPPRTSMESIRDIYRLDAPPQPDPTGWGESSGPGEGRGGVGYCKLCARRRLLKYPPNIHKALEGIAFAANHTKTSEDGRKDKDKWRYFARVIDRLFMFIYIGTCSLGALTILLNAETLFDGRKPLPDGI